jgi:hypothetical protein
VRQGRSGKPREKWIALNAEYPTDSTRPRKLASRDHSVNRLHVNSQNARNLLDFENVWQLRTVGVYGIMHFDRHSVHPS